MAIYWLERNAEGVPPGEQWLSEAEQVALTRLQIPKRRTDWRLGRWTAKLAVASHQRRPRNPEALAAIEILPAPSGAPEIFIDGRRAPLNLSLSHSEGIGFCAITAGDAYVGCDVERVAQHTPAFIEDYFTAEERDSVARSPATLRDLMVTLLWSAKESALKAMRCGLRADTRSVTALPDDVGTVPGSAWHSLTVIEGASTKFHGWWRESRGSIWTLVATRQSTRDSTR